MTEFQLPDMSCGHCAAQVSKALAQADPHCKLQIDLATRAVKVQSAEPRETLAQALREAGYPPA